MTLPLSVKSCNTEDQTRHLQPLSRQWSLMCHTCILWLRTSISFVSSILPPGFNRLLRQARRTQELLERTQISSEENWIYLWKICKKKFKKISKINWIVFFKNVYLRIGRVSVWLLYFVLFTLASSYIELFNNSNVVKSLNWCRTCNKTT